MRGAMTGPSGRASAGAGRVRYRPLFPPRYRLLVLATLFAVASVVSLVTVDPQYRVILIPIFACLNLAVFFVAILYAREGGLPLFESGTLWVAATTMYSVWPLVNFLLSGMRWSRSSDWRLVMYDPAPEQMGEFATNHVLYLATFVVTYLVLRGRGRVPRAFGPVPPAVQTAVIVTFLVMTMLVQVISFVALPPEASISPHKGGTFAYRADVPLVFLQFLNIGTNALLALKMMFAILLLSRWRQWRWRLVLFLWLPLEFFLITRTFSRAPFVLLLLTIVIAYHRLVRPLTLRFAAFTGIVLLTGFLAFGLYRDRGVGTPTLRTAFISTNEFQGLFANAYDIRMRRELGILPTPPPQMRWSELYLTVPSQLLPFEKVEPNEWYADVLQIRHTGLRTMFGVMAQAMIGYGAIEVFVRALLIAVILALVHRWYVRRAQGFWPTALYAYVTIWTFYTFRASTLSPLYFVVYYFGTAALMVTVVKAALVQNGRRAANR